VELLANTLKFQSYSVYTVEHSAKTISTSTLTKSKFSLPEKKISINVNWLVIIPRSKIDPNTIGLNQLFRKKDNQPKRIKLCNNNIYIYMYIMPTITANRNPHQRTLETGGHARDDTDGDDGDGH
jgi:hypothetical protein